MTTTDKLNAIASRIRELLAIAERRTPGRWGVEQTPTTNWVGPMRRNNDGKISIIICHTDRYGLLPKSLERNDADAAFIASCAGNFEAALRCALDQCEEFLVQRAEYIFIGGDAKAEKFIAHWEGLL